MVNKINPVIIFTYRRIIDKTIESLLKNKLASHTELFIFSDGYKDKKDKKDVIEVRKYISTIKGFKSLKIVESSQNNGLANSIINGVSNIINEYGNVIVLEDDLIVSDDFLEYMNDTLEFYKNNTQIWSISGYGPKLPCLKNYNKDLYLSTRGSSWGWATWKSRWDSVDWEVKDFIKIQSDTNMKRDFELGGNDMYKMLELQMLGKIDSWAIRWCFSQFIKQKYTIYPTKSKVINDGFNDNKGTHNSGTNDKLSLELDNNKVKCIELNVEDEIIDCFSKFQSLSNKTKIGYILKKYGGYKLIKKIIKNLQGLKIVRKV